MHKQHLVAVICILLFVTNKSYASTCPAKNASDVVSCALRNHPDIIAFEGKKNESLANIQTAKQRPNPDIGADILRSNSGTTRAEFGLGFVFERGEKRNSRISLANSKAKLIESENDFTTAKIAHQILLSLHEIRLTRRLISFLEEMSSLYHKSHRQFESQKWLQKSAEIDRDLLTLAEEESNAQIQLFRLEIAKNKAWLQAVTRADLKGWNWLPQKPAFQKLATPKEGSFSFLDKVYKSKIDISKSEIDLENANSYTNWNIGPLLEIENDSGETSTSFGVSFGMALPIFHQNEGQIIAAKRRLESEDKNFNYFQSYNTVMAAKYLTVYNLAVSQLKQLEKSRTRISLHKKLDDQANSNLLSPTTITSAHRELLEISKRQNELELEALQAKWDFEILNGTFFKRIPLK